tara:strand:- start:225 stop:383 length:159 start_codon:yes stop_codon:yes gene_type:complete
VPKGQLNASCKQDFPPFQVLHQRFIDCNLLADEGYKVIKVLVLSLKFNQIGF